MEPAQLSVELFCCYCNVYNKAISTALLCGNIKGGLSGDNIQSICVKCFASIVFFLESILDCRIFFSLHPSPLRDAFFPILSFVLCKNIIKNKLKLKAPSLFKYQFTSEAGLLAKRHVLNMINPKPYSVGRYYKVYHDGSYLVGH